MEELIRGAVAVALLLLPVLALVFLMSGSSAARVLCAMAFLGDDVTPEQIQRAMLGLDPYPVPIRRIHRVLRQLEAMGKVRRREVDGRWRFSCAPAVRADLQRRELARRGAR